MDLDRLGQLKELAALRERAQATSLLTRLSAVARRALARRSERQREKVLARATPLTVVSGYCCPRCHRWWPTPAERAECRESHWLAGVEQRRAG